jgi:hypothetical protein
MSITYTYIRVYDSGTPTHKCEAPAPDDDTKQCKQANIRYIHELEFEKEGIKTTIAVGCVCAARLTGMTTDALKDKEIALKSSSRDYERFLKAWYINSKGSLTCRWRKHILVIRTNRTGTYSLAMLLSGEDEWRWGVISYPTFADAKAKAWGVVGGTL